MKIPPALRALYLNREARLEELQHEMDRIQDEIVRLCAEQRFDQLETTHVAVQ